MLDGFLWHLEATAALELPPALLVASCDGSGNDDGAFFRPLHANGGRCSIEVPSAPFSPIAAAGLADAMVGWRIVSGVGTLLLCSLEIEISRSRSCGRQVVRKSSITPQNNVFPLLESGNTTCGLSLCMALLLSVTAQYDTKCQKAHVMTRTLYICVQQKYVQNP